MRMILKRKINLLAGLIFLCSCSTEQRLPSASDTNEALTNKRPNIIIIYVDDLGFGDIGVNGATGVETPYVDELARAGLNFEDAHASSATCTPSRYSLLTGEYAFRTKGKVLSGDAPLLIPADKETLPRMLKDEGYATAVVGKWHLGLGEGDLDWNGPITPGANEIGFDYSFLIPATGDRVPTVYVEDGRVLNLSQDDPITVQYGKKLNGSRPSGEDRPDLLRVGADPVHSGTIVNGVSRIGFMDGGETALWKDEDFADILTDKAVAFIRSHRDQPFFLYYSYHDIHVPRLPHPRFEGRSAMGPRGDAIAQMDWMTGRILQELRALGISENTIVVFSSDNGPVLNDGYADGAAELVGDHQPSGPFRGGKYSAFEAGARVPLIVAWPGTVEPGATNATVSQVDLYASIAKLLDHPLSANEAIDSIDLRDTFFFQGEEGRPYLFKEAARTVSIRIGDIKYIEELPEVPNMSIWFQKKNIDTGFAVYPQLYDLSADLREEKNIASENPALLINARKRLAEIRARTRRPD